MRVHRFIMLRLTMPYFACGFLLAASARADPAPPVPSLSDQVRWILANHDARDIKPLQAVAEGVLKPSSPYNAEEKQRIFTVVLWTLSSKPLGQLGGRPVAYQLARQALTADSPFGPGFKVRVLGSIDRNSAPPTDTMLWASDRKEQAGLMVELWSQLASELKDFDPNKRNYVREVPAPDGVSLGLPPGSDPEFVVKLIADLDKRKSYLDEVRENEQRSYKWRENLGNFEIFKSLLGSAENELVSAYSQPPFNLTELELLLEPIDPKNEVKQRIIAKVAQAMERKAEGSTTELLPFLK